MCPSQAVMELGLSKHVWFTCTVIVIKQWKTRYVIYIYLSIYLSILLWNFETPYLNQTNKLVHWFCPNLQYTAHRPLLSPDSAGKSEKTDWYVCLYNSVYMYTVYIWDTHRNHIYKHLQMAWNQTLVESIALSLRQQREITFISYTDGHKQLNHAETKLGTLAHMWQPRNIRWFLGFSPAASGPRWWYFWIPSTLKEWPPGPAL